MLENFIEPLNYNNKHLGDSDLEKKMVVIQLWARRVQRQYVNVVPMKLYAAVCSSTYNEHKRVVELLYTERNNFQCH